MRKSLFMRNLHRSGWLGVRVGVCLAILAVVLPAPSRAAEAGCEPDKMASKYPALAGKTINAIGDLCGLAATTTLGTTQEAMLRDTNNKCVAAGKPAVNIITSPDMPSGLRLVQSGRADLASVNKFVGDSMVASNPTSVESAFDIVTGAKISVGTAKGNSDLINAIKDGLAAIRANGTEKAIYERYHVDFSLTTDPGILTE